MINKRADEHSIPNIDVSANNIENTVPQIQHHISSAKHLHQVLFRVEFRISVVGKWVLNGANIRQWIWWRRYEERWLTYMTLLNKVSIACTTPVSMDVSVELFRVVCPIIELFQYCQYEKGWGQWNACSRSSFEPYQHLHYSRKSDHSVAQLIWFSNFVEPVQLDS